MTRKIIKSSTDQRPFSMIYHDFLKSIQQGILDNHYQIIIYIYLKMFSNENNQCYPSIKTLSNITNISEKKVKTTLKELEDKGLITKKNRTRPDGGKGSNLYTLYDYKELWNSNDSEEIATVIDGIEEKKMIQALTAKGYIVTKEKELESTEPSQVTAEPSTQQFNQSDIDNNITDCKKNQVPEKYTLNQIHQLFDYDSMLQEHPEQQQDIDSVMNVLYTAMNTSKPTIRIGGQDKPAMTVIGKFMRLDKVSILYAIKKYSEQTDRIKNPIAYITTILYTAQEQRHLDTKNKMIHEAANVDSSKETKKKNNNRQSPSNGFSNFQKREYDYDELEKMLLNR